MLIFQDGDNEWNSVTGWSNFLPFIFSLIPAKEKEKENLLNDSTLKKKKHNTAVCLNVSDILLGPSKTFDEHLIYSSLAMC